MSIRPSGRADSQFVRLSRGSLQRADFYLRRKAPPEGRIDIEMRNTGTDSAEQVAYELTLNGVGNVEIDNISLMLVLPKGVQYQAGTLRLNGNEVGEPHLAPCVQDVLSERQRPGRRQLDHGARLTRRATPEANSAIINIGSIAGLTANPVDTYSYDVSKAGIHMMTRNLAFTLSQQHVRVNAIAPGRFHSDMTEFAKQDPAAYEAELRMIPMHRWGDADDIKGVALMLASRAGAFITGQIIPIDGGMTLVA